ncbi:unnamed protein product [Trichobilharzia szidati]|nr:unnamed protein product [Trichobilharzia szidati]
MGVHGLTTYLQSDPGNFGEYELHNTNVIIDAHNFLNFLYFKSGIYTQFNGEYMGFSGTINRFICSLRRCNVNPIFVFDGCHEPFKLSTQVKRNHQRMQTCRNLLKQIDHHNLCPADISLCVQILPPLATITLVQSLENLKVDYITSDGESDQDVISLGIYLQCPVISNDSDFYITIPSNAEGVCFLPMTYISFEPVINSVKCSTCCRRQNKICAYLNCQRFLPNGSGLRGLPDVQRPLLASLLGNDYINSEKFLKALPVSHGKTTFLNKAASREMKMKRRRNLITSLIKWLSDFGANTQEPINRILDRYPKDERSKRYSELTQSIQSYRTDPESLYLIFAKYLPSLSMHDDVLCREKKFDAESDSCSTYSSFLHHSSASDSSCPSETDGCIDDSQLLNIKNDKADEDIDDRIRIHTTNNEYVDTTSYKVTSYWPEMLLDAFRKYLIVPIFLDSILSCGSVFVCSIEALKSHNSIYSDSVYLRSLIYNLILGVEWNFTFRFPDKLTGVERVRQSYYVTELDRKGSFYIKRRKVLVKPIELLPNSEINETDRRLAFLKEYLGLIHNPTKLCNNSWLTSVALLNVLIYRSKCLSTTDDITLCPVSLTFSTICICTYLLISHCNYSHLSYCKPIKKHFHNCANYFTTQLNTNNKKKRGISDQHKLNIHIVHVYGQLQIYYMIISTLVNLLNSLVTDNEREKLPTCLVLPHVYCIFPSGYLFHEVYYCISQIQSCNARHDYVREIIIEKLMNYQDNNKYVNDALHLFDNYLKILNDVQSTVSFVKSSANATTTVSTFCEQLKLLRLNNDKDDMVKSNKESVSLKVDNSKNVNTSKKKAVKKHKPFKKQFKQPSHAEIEERVAKLMLENGLLD